VVLAEAPQNEQHILYPDYYAVVFNSIYDGASSSTQNVTGGSTANMIFQQL
jgi:hypothetical protein